MHKHSSLTTLIIVALSTLMSCGRNIDSNLTPADLDKRSDELREEILNSPSAIDLSKMHNIYYVASDGNDANDGLSTEKPIKSIDKINSLDLQSGDCILFRRGDTWRGNIKAREGVTYSAYGKGAKPNIFGSPCDAAKEGAWTKTEVENVYVYDRELPHDVGTLVFNHGQECAFKVMIIRQENGPSLHIETKEPFASYKDLNRDLDFYHDYKHAKRIYLYSAKGNPAERFESIELLTKGHIISACSNVHIDNLCIKYCGSHGIGSGTASNLSVTNCEMGWIGGSIQAEDIFGRNHPTRYGNAIEIYGGCDNFIVTGCYIYQVYDAAITHQHQGDVEQQLVMKNILYSNNLIEDCVYSIEYFLGRKDTPQTHYMENILISNNIMRRSGYGWGKQRPDKETPAHIKSWSHHINHATNFLIANNIFDRSTHDLLNIAAAQKQWLPTLSNNIYIQHRNAKAGAMGYEVATYNFDDSSASILKHLFNEENPTIIFAEE